MKAVDRSPQPSFPSMAELSKRKCEADVEESSGKKQRSLQSRPIPPPDDGELKIRGRKTLIALFINPKCPDDNIWDPLPDLVKNMCIMMAHQAHVSEHRQLGFSAVLRDMMSFGVCTCTNRPDCKEHHPRNVLINWRYKVRVK